MKNKTLKNSALITLLLVLIFLSISFGSAKISLQDVFNSFFNPSMVSATKRYIITDIRIPRILCSIFCGGILALSGLVFQCVFRNSMADSYVLGISSGASAAVAFSIYIGLSLTSTYSLPLIAVASSLITAAFLFTFSSKNTYTLLLSGISVNFFLSALTTLFVHLGKGSVDSVMYWTMGSLANSNYSRVFVLSVCSFVFLLLLSKNSFLLDVLLLDDSTAISSGVNLNTARISLLGISSFFTAVVVSYCGVIGFVGLMSPHIGRLIAGPTHKKLCGISFILGAVILLFSDLISRTVLSPSELPVGIVTSLIGAPVFFFLLKRRNTWTQKH